METWLGYHFRSKIELPNPEQRLRTSMYADVVFQAGGEDEWSPRCPMTRSSIAARGRWCWWRRVTAFEPRPVKLGRRGHGYVGIAEGLKPDEEVVTSANFLIDAESNLKAALQAFSQQEPQSSNPQEARQ